MGSPFNWTTRGRQPCHLMVYNTLGSYTLEASRHKAIR